MRKSSKWVMGAMLTMSLVALTACGGSKKEEKTSETYDKNSKATITWLNILHTASPPTDTITKKIEKNTNTKLKFSWIPDASKEERINSSLASDSLADIVTLTMLTNSSVRNSLKSGAFWDVESYLKDYKNLSEISKDRLDSSRVDGKLYGVPFQKDYARNGVIIRKDWLDKLGLDVPKTTDELMAVAKAFTEKDPDGNGKDDTTGFMDRNDLIFGAFKTLSSYFGTPNNWSVSKNGKITPEFESKAYMKTMDYMKDAYDNGYINKDFAVTAKTDQQQKFAQGKAGIYVGALFDSKNVKNMAKGIQDNMELILVNDITSTGDEKDRAIWSAGNGVGGLLAFPKSEVKSKAELKRILQFIDELMEDKNYALMTYGIEGTHYTIDKKDAATITDQTLWQQEVQPFASSRPSESGYKIHDSDALKIDADKKIAENAKYKVLDPTVSLESETYDTESSELLKVITDATYQYILGEINKKEFNAAVEKWHTSGGDTVIKEYQASYKKAEK